MSIGDPRDSNPSLRLASDLCDAIEKRQEADAHKSVLLRTLVCLLLGALVIIIGLALT